jgi:hypothetical protein
MRELPCVAIERENDAGIIRVPFSAVHYPLSAIRYAQRADSGQRIADGGAIAATVG